LIVLAGGVGSGRISLLDRGMKGGTAGRCSASTRIFPIPEHDSTPAPGARARPDFRHWHTICLQRQD